jgi:hypothetical protein
VCFRASVVFKNGVGKSSKHKIEIQRQSKQAHIANGTQDIHDV